MNSDRQRRHQTRRGPTSHQPNSNLRSTSHNNNNNNNNGHRYISSSSSGGHQNYRHPTTMVSVNGGAAAGGGSPMGRASLSASSSSRSQQDQQNGTRCEASICYSYLVAIISSFLVVLGIYLTMTKFNIRYLYISLVGLLFEAIGACVYCLSNLKANTSARRKTTINSNDFIHLSANTSSGSNLLNSHPPSSIPFDGQQHRQLSTTTAVAAGGGTITHILSNGTLTGRTSDMDNADVAITSNQTVNNDNSSTAIDMGDVDTQLATEQQNNENIDNVNNSSIPSEISVKNIHSDQAATHELPKNQPSAGEACESSSATSLLDNHTGEDGLEDSRTQEPVVTEEVISSQTQVNHSQISDNTTSPPSEPIAGSSGSSITITNENTQLSAPSQQPSQSESPSLSSSPSTTSQHSSAEPLQNSDLTHNDSSPTASSSQQQSGCGLKPSDATDSVVALRKSASRQQRQANVRQTLVMGLGGEEEMIEIDEEDLDTMSILPPPYESIVGETSQQQQQQQFTDI